MNSLCHLVSESCRVSRTRADSLLQSRCATLPSIATGHSALGSCVTLRDFSTRPKLTGVWWKEGSTEMNIPVDMTSACAQL